MINNKKGEWYARDWLIGIFIFSGIIGLMYLSFINLAQDYGNTEVIDTNFSQKYDRFTNNSRLINSAFNVSTSSTGLSPVGAVQLTFQSVFSVISLTYSSIGIFNSQIANIFVDLGVPTSVSNIAGSLLIGSITITLIFIVITSTSRNRI